MYFNRKNAAQKNWRMIKKGKHFLFGCSLVFAVGATLVTPTVKADTVEAKTEASSTTEGNKPVAAEEDVTYAAPAVEVAPAAVAEEKVDKAVETTQNSKEELVVATEKAKEADGVQLPSLTVVADSSALTEEEKANIVEAVKGVNPTATDVQVQADGSVVVTFADGSSANLTAAQTVKVAAPAETSATQPKSRSRRAAGQDRSQDRSMEGKDIKFEYKGGKKIEDGDPTQRAKIEYRQLDDYEVVNGKTVPTDPSGQGRPVLEWTVTFNEAKYDKPGAFWYFSIPKNVSDPYNVVTEYDGDTYATRTEWNNGDGNANAEGKQFIDDGSKLENRVKLTTGAGEYDKVPGLNGVMANSKKLYVLQTNIGSGIRKFTVRYRTVVEDPSQTISYIAGVQAAKNLRMHNWYAISGKYDKELVSAVATPNVTPNLTKTSVNVPVQTVASTSSTLSGTGVPGATIKLYIDGQEQNIGNVTVDSRGNWTTGELPTALNNNQGDGTTIKPRQLVQVSQTVDGNESSRRTVPVSVGVTTVEPSSLTTNQDAVVAGQKEVTLKVPHDAGIAYMRYTNTAGETVEIPVKRDNASSAWTSQKSDKATVKSVENGKFQDTIVLTMADKIAGTEVAAISNVVEGGFSSVADWQPRSVENQAPTIASAVEGNKKTVAQGAQLDLASLVTVADKEDDAQATLGDKVHAEVVSVNGNAATKTVDTNTQGTYTVKYKAVDSQGKESGEIEVTVVVENVAPTKPVINTNLTGKAKTKTPIEVTADPGTTVELFDKDNNKIGEATADNNGKATITPTADIPAGNVTAKATKNGKTSDASNASVATPVVPEKALAQPTKEGDKSVTVAVPASKPDNIYVTIQGKPTNLRLQPDGTYDFIKNDANATVVNNPDGTITLNLPEGTTLKAGDRIVTRTQNDDPSKREGAVASQEDQTYPQLNQPEKVTVANPSNLTDDEKAAVKAAVKKANPSVVESELEVDGQGNVTYKHKGAGVNVPSEIATLTLTDTVQVATTPTKPVIKTDLTGKAKTKTPIEVTADPGTTVELFDKDNNKIGEATADENGKATITPTADIPAGNVTAKATKNGKTSDASNASVATPVVPEKALAQPTKEGDKSVTVAVPASKPDNIYVTIQGKPTNLRLQPDGTYDFIKNDANATVVNNPDGTITLNLPEGTTLKAGDRIVTRTQNDDPSKREGAVASQEDQTYPQLNQPEKVTVANPSNLTDDEKAAVKAAVKKANPSVVESELEVDGQGNVTYKHKGAGVNVPSEIATLTLTDTVQVATTPTKPVIKTDLTGKAKTKTPIEVTADPGTTVELFDKDNNKIGEATADENGKATITPTADIPAGNVTAKATKNGKTSDASNASVATPVVPEKALAQPTKEGDKSVTVAVPASKPDNIYVTIQGKPTNLRLQPDGTYDFIKNDANATVVNNPDGTITLNLPEGTTLKAGDRIVTRTQNDDPSKREGAVASQEDQTYPQLNQPEKVTVANPSNLTDDEKAAVKAAVKKANPSVVESELEVDGQGNVTYKHKGAGVNVPSEIATLTLTDTVQVATTPTKPVIKTDLTGKAGTKTPVEVTAEPGSTVELFDKDGKKIGEGVADENGKATIEPKEALPEGEVTAKATDKAGNVSDPSEPKVSTDTTAPAKPVVETDLTGKAGTKTPVEVTAEPGSTVELFDKDGKKIGEGVADENGKATIEPKEALPEGEVTAKATDKAGNVSDPSEPKVSTDTTAPAKPVVETDLTGKAGTKTPVEVTAEPGSTVELFDKDGKKIGEGVADENGKATIEPKEALPEGEVTAKATDKAGNVSDPSEPKVSTDTTAPAKPVVETDLTGKAGTKTPVEVTAEPGSTVELFDKDGKKIGEGVADENGKATIEPKEALPEGEVTAKATDKAGNVSDPSEPKVSTDTTAPAKPVVETDLTGKAGTKTPVEVTAEPGSTVELFDKDGKKIGEGVADENGKATIEPKEALPEGEVTAKATDKAGNVSDPSEPKVSTDTTAPAKPVVETDLTGKAGTKTPVEVTAEPGSTVELFDKDGKKIGEGVADENGKATIEPKEALPEGEVTAKATDKAGNVSDPSEPKVSTDTTAPAKPVVETDLTGKAGTKTPVEVTAEPGSTVELFDKDGKKIGEGVADENGKATIEPKEALPEGEVTAKATDKAGNVSDPSEPKVSTDTTAPAKPVVETDLTGKAGTKTPVEVTAEPGSTVELFDKDGKKIGEGVADENGKATIEPKEALPEGEVTAKATDKAGNVSDPSEPKVSTDTTAPAKPVVETDLTGKAGTKTPVEVTAEPGSTVELFDKDGKKIGEGVADENGKATIEPKEALPEGEVTAKATDKAGNVSDPSEPKVSTDTTAPAKPVVETDLTGKAGTKTPVEVTAEPGSTVELFDKDGKKIGEGVADENGKATITPTVDIPAGGVTAIATDPSGNTSDASDEKVATATTPAKDPEAKTPVKDPANLTDAEKAKVAEEVKKANPTAKDVEVGKDGTTTVTFPDGSKAEIPAAKTVEKAKDAEGIKDPEAKTPVKDPANLTDAEKAKVADEVKKANPTAKDVEVGKDGTTTVTFPDGSKAVIPADKTVKKSDDKVVTDPAVTPVTDPSNLTDAEKAKVADEVKKANPTVSKVEVGSDGTATVTYPDGTTAVIPADKTVKKSDDKVVTDPSVTPVTDPSNLTDAEKAKVADEVKKANPTVSKVEVGNDGTTTVTYPDGTTAVIPADKTVKKSDDKAVKDPAVTPVVDPSNLTDAEKAKVADEVKKDNPTAKDVEVGNDGTTTVTYPDGTTAVIPADKTVKKSDDKAVKDPAVTPVVDPSNLTDAEKAKVADEVKKANPTAKDVEVGKDGTTTVTYPDGTTAVIPADKTVKKSDDKAVKDPAVTPVVDPSNLTDAEKAKVADEVKKANPTVTDVKVDKDGITTVTYPDGTTAVIPADKTVKKSADKELKDPSVTPVTDPSNLTDAEKGKVAEEVKKSNPTVTDVKVDKDGTTTVTYPDGTTAVIPADKTVKKSADKELKDPSVTPVVDPSNLTDLEKAKVAEEVKKANPTLTDVTVGNDGTATVTYPDGTTAVIPADKTVKKSADKELKDPTVTPVTDPSNLTDTEKAKVADEVKKSNPTVTDVTVGNDGTATVTYPDGTTAVIPADKTVKKSADKDVKDPAVTPVVDPSNLTDAEKAKVADEVKKSNPTVTDVTVGNDGTATITYPDGKTTVIPADKTVKKSSDKVIKDPVVTPVADPSNLTDAEKAKVADEVKKANPTVTDVKVDEDGTTTVTYPDGTTAVIPADKTVKKSDDKVVKDPSVTPVTDPSNLTDAEKGKVAEEVKKSNPTVTDVKVDEDGTTTVTYPDGTTAVIPADKTIKKSDDKAVKDPSVTPVTDPSNLTDAEKGKVAEEVKKSNPTVSKVEVGNDGTTTVTYPDGTTAVIPADKTVKKSADKDVKDPSVTPVTDPSNLTDAEKGKVAEEVKKSNPTVTDVKVDKDGTTTVTYPDGTTAVIPADKTVKKSADKAVKDPSVTPVTDPSNLTDAEKAKVAEEVKKSNPTVTDVKVDKDGTTTVTYPDGTTAVIPADKTVKKSADKAVKDPSVTPVTDPSNLTDAEKAKVADEVKKSNPTVSKVEVGNDGTTTVTYPDGTTAVIPADKTVKKSADKAVKDPSVTPVTDPSNLTDAEKAKVAEEVKKANPTVTDVKVEKDGTTTVTYPDGTTAVIPADKTVKKSADKVVTNPTVTPVVDPSNLTDAEKAKVADKVKKANPTASKVEVGNDGTATVTFPDGSVVVLTPAKTVKSADSNGVKNPSVTPVTDPSNLTDAEKAKVADEVKKANPTATDIKVNNDGSVVVTFADGSVAVIASEKAVKEATKESAANQSAKKAGAKELPNTGTEQSNASLGLALLAAVTGGFLISKKRKEEE